MQTQLESKQKGRLTHRERMLANPDVMRWYCNMKKITADNYLGKLSLFCRQHEVTPMELLDMARKDTNIVADLLIDHVRSMEECKKNGGYQKNHVKAVKSWLKHFGIRIERNIHIKNPKQRTRIKNERPPEAKEMAEMFNLSDVRTGAEMALVGKSGVRPEVLGNYDATDGLTIADLPDLAIVRGLAVFTRKPARIVVRAELSKNGHEYFTFLTSEGCKKVIAYLNQRILSGEALGPDTPVISPSMQYNYGRRGNNDGKKFLITSTIRTHIRETIQPRFTWRPYILRKFFAKRMKKAEVDFEDRQFFMGQSGTVLSQYTMTGLSDEEIEDLRKKFKSAEEFLDIEITNEDPTEIKKEQLKASVETMTSEELERVQMLLESVRNCNTIASNSSSHQKEQKTSFQEDSVSLGHCQITKWSSKKETRNDKHSGSRGIRTHDSRIKSPVRYLAAP